MNKFILGSILAAISLMAIYGTSASDQVTSWVDGGERPASQGDFGQAGSADEDSFISLNPTETDRDTVTDISQTPLEKAGNIPQRQTIGASPNFGAPEDDDTGGEVVQADPPAEQTTPDTTTNSNNQTQPGRTPTGEVIRALW